MKLTRLGLFLTVFSLGLAAQTPAQVPPASASGSQRIMSLFFDLNGLDAATLAQAQESAIRFIQNQVKPADLVSVMTYGAQLNVLQDFTSDRDSVVTALRRIMALDNPNNTAGQLAALDRAVQAMSILPVRKGLLYSSGGAVKSDDPAQLRMTLNAAIKANVQLYPIDARGFAAIR